MENEKVLSTIDEVSLDNVECMEEAITPCFAIFSKIAIIKQFFMGGFGGC